MVGAGAVGLVDTGADVAFLQVLHAHAVFCKDVAGLVGVDAVGNGGVHLEERGILRIHRECLILLALGERGIGEHICRDGVVKDPTLARSFHATVVLLVERPLVEPDAHLAGVNHGATHGEEYQHC